MTRKKAVSHQPSAVSGCKSSIAARLGAFTLIELMVVIGVVGLLITALVIAGGGLIDDAKEKDTLSVMQVLNLAIEEFRQDAPLKGVVEPANPTFGYRTRYGDYPCDELEVFRQGVGIPGAATPSVVGPPGGLSDIRPVDPMRFMGIQHRDVAAMALAIRLYSAEGAAVLDKIGNRFKKAPANRTDFFDRNGDSNFDIDDEPLVYFVDAWGNPFEYFAIRPGNTGRALADVATGNRLATAMSFVRANRGKPLLVSYGPDGADQIAEIGGGFTSALVEDFSNVDPIPRAIDSPLNADNVYLDGELAVKLRVSAPEFEMPPAG